MIIINVGIRPSISEDGKDIRGNIYIHSKGMKLNASSLILLCQISDKNERKIVETSSRVSKEPRRRPHFVCCIRLELVKVATRIQLHVWTHINNNQTYINL